MTLLKHRQEPHTEPAQSPYRSLVLPAAPLTPPPAPHPAAEATWTCARCGSVASDIAAAREHINLHSLQSVPECEGAAARPRGDRRRRRALRAVRERARIAR